MFRTLALIAAMALSSTAVAADKSPQTFTYDAKVISVTDGDTIKVEIAGWPAPFNPIGVRVNGIDTPEKRFPPAKTHCEVAMGKKSSAYAKTLIPVGGMVKVVYENGHKDKYNRLLARVILPDGRDYTTVMIQSGLARPYQGKTKSIWCND